MNNHQKGITLIEVLIVVVIVAITLSMAVPGWQSMTARNRIATQSNDMLVAVNLARSEALRVGGTVSVLAIDPNAADEFGGGWCVVRGDAVANPATVVCTNADRLVRNFVSLGGDSTLNSVEDVSSLQFNSLGALKNIGTGNSRSLDLCAAGQSGRRIYINAIGRSESNKADPDNPNVAKDPVC